jgi:hypothetical protein
MEAGGTAQGVHKQQHDHQTALQLDTKLNTNVYKH